MKQNHLVYCNLKCATFSIIFPMAIKYELTPIIYNESYIPMNVHFQTERIYRFFLSLPYIHCTPCALFVQGNFLFNKLTLFVFQIDFEKMSFSEEFFFFYFTKHNFLFDKIASAFLYQKFS